MSVDYDDLTKPTLEFFSKGFPSNKLVKIGTETKTDFLTLKTTSQRTFVRSDGKEKEVYDTIIEPKIELKDYDTTVELKLQTQNVYQGTVSKKDLVKGLKLSIGASHDLSKEKTQNTINLGAEFQHDKFFFKVKGGIPLEEQPFLINGNLVFQPFDKVFLGAKYDLKYSTKEKKTTEPSLVELKAAVSSGNTKGYLTGTLDKKLGLFVVSNLNSDDILGLKVSTELPSEGKSTKLAIDLAYQHQACKSTTVQSKLNLVPPIGDTPKQMGLRFGLGCSHTLTGTASIATAGVDVDVGSFFGI